MSLEKCLCYDGQACRRVCGPATRGLFSAAAIAASTRSKPAKSGLTAAQTKRVVAATVKVEREHLAEVKAVEQEAETHEAIMASFGTPVRRLRERIPAGRDVHAEIMASFGVDHGLGGRA